MSPMLRIGKFGGKSVSSQKTEQPGNSGLVGKTVEFAHEGQRILGVVKSLEGSQARIIVALPDMDGLLHKTGSEVIVAASEFDINSKAVVSDVDRIVKAWAAQVGLTFADGKAPTPIYGNDKGKDLIMDYRDVRIEGFLSTFTGTTPRDRDGDYVESHAFDKTLADFRRNPVMLIDHQNSVHSLAGSFDKIGVNKSGLAVSGMLSNAPGVIDTRFKVAEGHLKSLSMGGLFYYKEDGKGIEEVTLYEGSLTPVPANPDALFQVRSLTVIDAAKAMKSFRR